MEYTKGDWEARELNKQQENAYAISCEEFGVDIAFVARYDINSAEQEGNAHLIAKSPRMYELLEKLVTGGWNAYISMEAEEILQELAEGN